MLDKIKYAGSGLIIGCLLSAGICVWMKYRPSLDSVLAQPAQELAKEETKRLDCKPILVYRDAVEKKLGLPETVKRDPDKHVVASSKIEPSDHPHTMTAVYDSGSGRVDMFLRQDQLPWIAFNRRGSVGMAYGFKDNHNGAIYKVYAKYEMVQIKALHAGLTGDIDNASGWFGGGYLEMKW